MFFFLVIKQEKCLLLNSSEMAQQLTYRYHLICFVVVVNWGLSFDGQFN